MLTSPIAELRSEAAPGQRIKAGIAGISLPKSPLFGTDGIRSKAGELLNAGFVVQLGFWAGQVLKANSTNPGPIIIGQDSRNSSDMLANALTAGLTTAGLEVWNLGLCPTPCVSYLTRLMGGIGGAMISASHNPPEDNGIKFFNNQGLKLEQELATQIEAGLRGQLESINNSTVWGKQYQRTELVQDYLNSLGKTLPENLSLAGMRVVLDPAWGASVNVAPQAFRELGAEVMCLHQRADGDRINVNCGSTHLEPLKAAVLEYDADLGFGFDGDADRVMAVDSKGRTIDGDHILYLWGQKLKATDKLPGNLIVATVMANLGFERAWRDLGGDFVRTAVGDRYVQAEMFDKGAMLGGEQSGHILCHHHSFSGDGLQTALHLTSLVCESGVSLADLVDRSFQTYPQLLKNVRVEDRERRLHWQECEPLQEAIARAQDSLADTGRILVRASGTEPLIRVMVEAASLEATQYWTDELVSVVDRYFAA